MDRIPPQPLPRSGMNSKTTRLLADASADIFGEEWEISVLDKVEALCAIEGEFLIARQQGQTLGDGVSDNHVVARVAVVLSEVQAQTTVGVAHVGAHGQELDAQFILHDSEHFL